MNINEMNVPQKFELIGNLLDQLSDARGRAKCSCIYVINEVLEQIKAEIFKRAEDSAKNPEMIDLGTINLDEKDEADKSE